MRILLADTETTDVDADAEICEFAFLEIDMGLNVLAEFSALVKPKRPINPAASAVSGITNKMVESSPTIEAVLSGFPPGAFQDIFLIAHNLKFDRRLLAPYWDITGGLCTLRAAQYWLPDAPNHKLHTLQDYLGMDIDIQAHSAGGDVQVVKLLLEILIERSGAETLPAFIAEEAKTRTLVRMPWGKHKGVRLEDLPGGYVGWLLGLQDLDPELRTSLQNRFRRATDEDSQGSV